MQSIALENTTNAEELFKMIDSCEGRVDLISDEGDIINMKSKLSQLLVLSNILSDPEVVGHIRLVAYYPEDEKKLLEYSNQGKLKE